MSDDEATAVTRHPLRDEEQGSVIISPGLHILLQILAGAAARDNWYKAERIHRSELAKRYGNAGRFRESSGNIAAIDFGTTFCSVAYTTPEDKISTLKLEKYYARVPSAILLKEKEQPSLAATGPVGKTPSYEVVCFGYEAQDKHSKIRTSERKMYLYFERFKMTLQHDESVNRNMTVKASNGNRYYMVEVIAFILGYLKQELVKHLSHTTDPLEAKDFEWVVTVPAIWRARGKRMMREAAYMAGLCSAEDGIDCFTIAGRGLRRPAETNPDRLTLALEPEAAAIYCLARKENEIAAHCRFTGAIKSDQYLVVDIGGGTVDITAHRHDGNVGGIRVLVSPKGNDCGGTQVNYEFSKFLQKIFHDEATDPSDQTTAFPKFFRCDDQASRQAIISNLIFGDFEHQKLIFGNNASGFHDEDPATDGNEITVTLPPKVIDVYGLQNLETGIAALQDDRIQLEDGKLFIKYAKLRELFQSAVDGILECTASVLEEMKTEVDTVYLVGGFGGCKYIYEKMYSLVQARCQQGLRIIVPKSHELAVAQGAVEYRRNPEIIRSRKMDASYGTDFAPRFNPAIHDIAYAVRDPYGDIRVRDVFMRYVEKDEVISADEVVTSEFYPMSEEATSMPVAIYSSFSSGVKYIKNSDGIPKADVRKIGEFIIKMPNDAKLTREERPVELTMDFAHTEIQVRARYLVQGYEHIEIKTIADFLSEQT